MMTVLKFLLVAVEVLCCLLLVGSILIQRTKNQGMGLAFGAQMGEQLFGAQMGNVLTRSTVILAIVFLVTTTLLAMLGTSGHQAKSVTDSVDGAPVPMAGQTAPAAAPGPIAAPEIPEVPAE